MKNVKLATVIMGAFSLVIVSCDKNDNTYVQPQPPAIQSTIVKVAGDSVTVAAKLAEFRVLLGDPVNSTPNQTTGRREVNWDGAPVAVTNNNSFPLDFFNNTDAAGPNGRKRGLQYVNNGTLIRLDSSDFSEIER